MSSSSMKCHRNQSLDIMNTIDQHIKSSSPLQLFSTEALT